jgi:hypothetical protein
MISDRSFGRVAGLTAIISLPVAVGNLLTIGLAVHFNLNAISNPLLLIHTGVSGARWWHFSMILDTLGYYLMIVPLTLVLRKRFLSISQDWTNLFVLSLLAYSFIGAAGGAILASGVPPIITSFASASASHRAILDSVGTGFSNAVYRGLWNLLEEFLAAIGWFGMGMLTRAEHRRLSSLSMVLGIACLVDAIGTAANVDSIATTGLTVYLVLAPIWACWWGFRFLANQGHDTESDPPRLSAYVRGTACEIQGP